MKALILKTDNGERYEDYREYVTHVFLVPDSFDAQEMHQSFLLSLEENGVVKLSNFSPKFAVTERGRKFAESLYPDYLKLKGYEQIPFAEQ